MTTVPIPARCAHLPTIGGLAQPWGNVHLADGGVDFRSHHRARHVACWTQRLCQVCGQHLTHPAVLLGGPTTMVVITVSSPCADEWSELIRFDWVVARSWNRLHYVHLTPEELDAFAGESILTGPVRLACGRTASSVCIPGFVTRMHAERCARCCRVTGLPRGVGSPKNDLVCRAILGLPTSPQ